MSWNAIINWKLVSKKKLEENKIFDFCERPSDEAIFIQIWIHGFSICRDLKTTDFTLKKIRKILHNWKLVVSIFMTEIWKKCFFVHFIPIL